MKIIKPHMEKRINLIRQTEIDSNEMNQALTDLYKLSWDKYGEVREQFSDYSLSNILLLSVPDDYPHANLRSMILGKETMGWGGEFEDTLPSIHELQQLYELYINEENGNGAAFQRFVNWFRTIRPGVSVLSNNIVKVGKHSTNGYYKCVADALDEKFNLLLEEIKITRPQVIVCPTSNIDKYNERLEMLLGQCMEEQILQEDLFVSVRYYEFIPTIPLIMCPHPQGKKRVKLNEVKKIIDNVIEGIIEK